MPILTDGRFFSATSPLPNYEREMKRAEDAIDVVDFVTLARGMFATHWHKQKPDKIEVSREMYDAMMNRIESKDHSGIGHSIGAVDGNVIFQSIPITCRRN